MEDALLNQDDLKVHSTLNAEVSVARVARALEHSGDALLVISGIGRDDLRTDRWKELVRTAGEERISTAAGDGESVFKKMCREKPGSTVYWLAASAELVFCKTIYESGFYMKRRWWHHRVFIFNIAHFANEINTNVNIQSATFVFQTAEDKRSLIGRLTINNGNRDTFLRSEHIKTAATGEKADHIIKENPDRPVHVLKPEGNGGPILWMRSRGSLEGLRPYLTAGAGEPIDEEVLCNTSQKAVIISDEPGMGKSTSLTSVSRLLRAAWVVRVDLKDFQIPIQNLPTELSLNSVCEFILRGQGGWLRGLLQFCLDTEHKNSRDVYIFFDGFDEIKRDSSAAKNSAEDKVMRLMNYLNNETAARVWVTTRLYRREILENALSVFAMKFERIDESQQRRYLVKFWRSHLLLELHHYGEAEERKLEKCAEFLYKNAKKVLGDDIQNFMGIPLQMRMLAEVFRQPVKLYVEADADIGNTFDVKSVLDLYQQFISLKYDIYFNDKTGLTAGMSGEIKHSNVELLTEKHRMLGLRTLFPKFAKEFFDDPEAGWGVELCRVGLVQSGGNGSENVEFVHRTLAEYFCADLAVDWLRKKGRYHGHAPVVEFLLTEILLRDSHNVIRIFIDNLVLSQPLSGDAAKFCALKISRLWRKKQYCLFDLNHQPALHLAVKEGNTGVIDILVGGFKCEPVQLVALIAAHDQHARTALGLAAQMAGDNLSPEIVKCASREIMKKLVHSLETCPYEVILELLLATYVRFTFVLPDEIDELKLLGDYLKREDICLEITRAFARTMKIIQEIIPPLIAAVRGSRPGEVAQIYGDMENDTERRYVLLAPDRAGETVLHRAASDKNDEKRNQIIKTLCIANIPGVGRSYDRDGVTTLHRAAAAGHLDIVELLINRGVHIDSQSRLRGDTALFSAARFGQVPVVKYLINNGTDINILKKNGENVLFSAVRSGNLSVVEYLVEKGSDVNVVNKDGETPLSQAGRGQSFAIEKYLKEKVSD